MKKIFQTAFIYTVTSICVFAQSIYTPKYSNEFLNIGIGARGLGMGQAQTSATNDVTSAYWNPAGLVNISKKYDVAIMHNEYFAGLSQFDYIGFATKIDTASTLAISVMRQGIDNISDTRYLIDANGQINYNNIRYFSATDNAFLVSYARKNVFTKGLNVGGNMKIIYRNVGSFANAWGFGLDFGVQYEIKKFKIGAILKDGIGSYNLWFINTATFQETVSLINSNSSSNTQQTVPENSIEVTLPSLNLGISRSFAVFKKFDILGAVDFFNTFDGRRNTLVSGTFVSIDPRFGLELSYAKIAFLRMGVNNIQRAKDIDQKEYWSIQPNFGVGFKIQKFSIDYALTNLAKAGEGLYSNVFSVRFTF